MNLTLSQAVERAKDLSGEIKAARAHEADCAADHEAKRRIAEIAGEAHEKASAHCIALETEREELADHMAALVRKTGEPLLEEPGAALDGPVSFEGFGSTPFIKPADEHANDLADRLMAQSEEKITAAFMRAT